MTRQRMRSALATLPMVIGLIAAMFLTAARSNTLSPCAELLESVLAMVEVLPDPVESPLDDNQPLVDAIDRLDLTALADDPGFDPEAIVRLESRLAEFRVDLLAWEAGDSLFDLVPQERIQAVIDTGLEVAERCQTPDA